RIRRRSSTARSHHAETRASDNGQRNVQRRHCEEAVAPGFGPAHSTGCETQYGEAKQHHACACKQNATQAIEVLDHQSERGGNCRHRNEGDSLNVSNFVGAVAKRKERIRCADECEWQPVSYPVDESRQAAPRAFFFPSTHPQQHPGEGYVCCCKSE